jgi:micrococcal nuclease
VHGAVLALALGVLGAARPPDMPTGRVVAVGDGDTITVQLGDHRERVRLIGVDSPELHESAKLDRDAARSRRSRRDIQADGGRARAYTAEHLLGRTVALERDVETRDRYGRLLAYVWLEGTLFNVELVRDGWARTLTVPPNVRHVDELVAAQREARAARRGLWGERDAPRRPAAPSRRSASSTAAAASSTARSGSPSASAARSVPCSRRLRSSTSTNAR